MWEKKEVRPAIYINNVYEVYITYTHLQPLARRCCAMTCRALGRWACWRTRCWDWCSYPTPIRPPLRCRLRCSWHSARHWISSSVPPASRPQWSSTCSAWTHLGTGKNVIQFQQLIILIMLLIQLKGYKFNNNIHNEVSTTEEFFIFNQHTTYLLQFFIAAYNKIYTFPINICPKSQWFFYLFLIELLLPFSLR